MSPESLPVLIAGIFCIALLYSSVGHAGASGYIAVMTLFSLAPEVIKPTALCLNILVASIASWQFARAGHFSWPLFWPLALPAMPLAFLGGYLNLPAHVFKVVVGIVLIYSATRFLMPPSAEKQVARPSLALAMFCGGAIGLLAGLTGTGGGIFLTPLLLLMGWARTKEAAAVSAVFILLNSVAGLLGNVSSTSKLPEFIPQLLIAAAIGGGVGAYFGSTRLPPRIIKRFLAAVLLIAGGKLILA